MGIWKARTKENDQPNDQSREPDISAADHHPRFEELFVNDSGRYFLARIKSLLFHFVIVSLSRRHRCPAAARHDGCIVLFGRGAILPRPTVVTPVTSVMMCVT